MAWMRKIDEKLAHLTEYLAPGGPGIPGIVKEMDEKKIIEPNIPIGVFLQEAYNILQFAQDDCELLVAGGLNPKLMNDLPRRIQFLRKCDAAWWESRFRKTPVEMEFLRAKKLAMTVRKELLRHFSHLAIKDKNLNQIVKNIEDGDGLLEDMFDLKSLHRLCIREKDRLIGINVDSQLFEDVAFCAENLMVLYVKFEADMTKEQNKRLRNQAYTYLLVAVEELRRVAYHVFWHDKDRLRGYLSDYFRRKP